MGSPIAGRHSILFHRRSRDAFSQAPRQPGPRIAPVTLQGADRYTDDAGRFLDAQPDVIAELDDFRQLRVFRLELLDRLVQGEQIAARRLDPGQSLGQLDALYLPSVLDAALVAGLFDED